MNAPRLFLTSQGEVYRAWLAPHEAPRGVAPGSYSLCFETRRGEWVGAVPLWLRLRMDCFTGEDLEELMGFASGAL